MCYVQPRDCDLSVGSQEAEQCGIADLGFLSFSFGREICCWHVPVLGRPLSSMMLAEILIVQ